MSDSTANAREPSMEDILASIRRIIDEEDSRDARPAAEDAVVPDVEDGAMPVMAAAPADRDAAPDETDLGEEGDGAIFPERGSPFWSRATGRDGETGETQAADEADEEASAPDPSAPTDIFTRARNKLDGTKRPSARERMQSLAARARDAENRGDVRLSMPDAPTDFDSTEAEEVRVLDLTDTVDLSDARENLASITPAEREMPEQSETYGEDDILDLTTPIGEEAEAVEAGHVESGDSFHVSEVPEEEAAETDAYHADEAADDAETASPETATDPDAAFVPPANTYSRFDSASAPEDVATGDPAPSPDFDGRQDDAVMAEVEEPVEEAEQDDVVSTAADDTETGHADNIEETYGADFTVLDDDAGSEEPTADDSPAPETATDEEAEADRSPLDAFSLDAEEEPLGFTDTFGASDVYHDDPPELDEDYSRSFDAPEEPLAARADPDEPHRDDMETVGGMVRDAMERDPVDYADPAALVSMTSEEISARALASLADVEGEASRRMYASMQVSEKGDSESIEGMVRGMLRPMLREWLDDNLPSMVESAVRGEVERISAKSRRYSRASDDD